MTAAPLSQALFEPRERGRHRGGGREVNIQLGKLFDKIPPHAPEAEMALLGAMLLEPKVTGEVISIVKTAEAFYLEAHGVIYAALVQLYDRHNAGDLAMLADLLREKQVLADVGGADYLAKLARETPSAAAALYFAKQVAQKYTLRRLISAAGQIAYEAYHSESGPEGAETVIDSAQEAIFQIAEQGQENDPARLEALLQIEFERLLERDDNTVSGIPTGYPDLDSLTSGLQNGEMVIVAARPSMGKTALALNLAEQIALGRAPHGPKHGEPAPVGFFSLEMSKSAIAQRLLSAHSGVSSHKMRSGRLPQQELDRAMRACEDLRDAPIYIDDTPGLTVLGLRTRARRMKQQYKLRCVVIDYLQLMTAPGSARESRQVEVSAISRGIKALARELDLPIICLSQLNRGPESRGDNRPRMSDLRESGSIEQDADVVMLLHREEYYHVGDQEWKDNNPDKAGVAELIIAKQRNGPTDVVNLVWDAQTTRFKSASRFASGGGYAPDPGFGSLGGHGPGAGYGGGHAGEGRGGASAAGGPGALTPRGGSHPGGFAPGRRTGPVSNFRDGGGPVRDSENDHDADDLGGAPF
ncbi:MAG TPA: replicative DNA helicase [Phycisphaerales bacterium]|nr:replicative DNA helicase [Phycisphaerales bacterium]